ncbi:MAG: UvrD-helicase domain-containing protein [Sedimenticola sp.]
MRVLLYNEIKPAKIPGFKKMKAYLEADDFRSAEVKKVGDNLYRARLDRSNRLLFAIHHYQGEAHALILECIKQHAYEKSRFLNRGVLVEESKITPVVSLDEVVPEPLIYVNPDHSTFNMLDKIISFDEVQSAVYALQAPLIIIGSAGSGKTALTLEKMKEAVGDILYVTRSPYLVHNSRDLYYADGYANKDQQIDFLSFQEYLESIHVPEGREMHFREFSSWFARRRATSGLRDAHQLFEEFKGVITGPATDASYLGKEAYLGLGIKQSIFSPEEREQVYNLFGKYLETMKEQGYYDANILSHEYLAKVEPRYDFIVMDEVQDLTNIQMQLILKSLRDPSGFILCGDSNQIVHPNFFSWSSIKSYFYKQDSPAPQGELIRILNTNYRNSPQVTEVANRVLKIKNARFGSIDKESNYLVKSNAHNTGRVILLQDEEGIKAELDRKTRHSTRFAIIVMYPEDKAAASRWFGTPLVFSVQEAKGLEYENILLYNFTSGEEQRFREITRGVGHDDLQQELTYARTKDKSDKSLEIYKFHINALYVAITRAVRNIYLIERSTGQRMFDLLDLRLSNEELQLDKQDSSLDEWRLEAQRLELQGKQEQAESIRTQILKQKSVPWEVLHSETLDKLQHQAIEENNKKAKVTLFEYALVYRDQPYMNALILSGFAPAKSPEKGLNRLNKKHFLPYELKHPGAVLRQTDQFGVDFRNLFNQTPLMIASRLGNEALVRELRARGANTELINNAGFNAFLIALEQALDDQKYSNKKLAGVYRLLEPDCLDIQVDERLIKLDKRSMEFLMLNLMIAMFYTRMGRVITRSLGGFQSRDYVEVLEHFPEHLLPARRKKRPYISSILSKNEVSRDDKYNRKLFLRVERGHYIINPGLSLRVEGEWRSIYELLSFDKISHVHEDHQPYWHKDFDYNAVAQHQIKRYAGRIKAYAETGRWNDYLGLHTP